MVWLAARGAEAFKAQTRLAVRYFPDEMFGVTVGHASVSSAAPEPLPSRGLSRQTIAVARNRPETVQ